MSQDPFSEYEKKLRAKKNYEKFYEVVNSTLRFTKEEITHKFFQANHGDIWLGEGSNIESVLDFWCKSGDLEFCGGIYFHPDRI